MNCPSCSAALPVDARFCPGCGSRLAAASPAAVSAPPPAWTSGPAQGNSSPAALSAARSEVRKTVTVLFCDLVGFTPLSQRLDPEALRGLMLEYFALMRDCVERHGGVVEKYIGDAVMAVFGVPAVHEDDPVRAVRAAAEMQAALAGLSVRMFEDLGVTLGIRIGVNTGPVVAVVSPAEAGSLVAGDTVNMAARLQQHAEPGQVLLGPLTCLAVRGMADYEPTGPMTLKGIARPVTPARLVAVVDEPRSAARGTDRPLVNRHSELAGLQAAFRRAERGRHCLLVTVHGDAGIGKSRLTSEFAAWASESGAIVVEGRCPGYGAGGSALALAEAVRQLLAVAGEPERDGEPARHGEPAEAREALAVLRRSLLTDGSPGLVADETAWALSQLLAQSGRSRPVVLILEDMQWADSPLLALVSEMVRRIDETPVLVLCLGRPEFLVEHGDWPDDLPDVESTAVGPLSESDCLQLVAGLDDTTAHDAGLMARAVARAEGNPLYLEQFISASSADDLSGLADADGGGTAASIPVGINGLIAYRLDLLRPAEREVLGLAAVCGRRFTPAGIAAAADPGAVPWHAPSHGSGQDLAAILNKLTVRRLIRPQGAPAAGYRFESALVHEVAYGSLPKRWRATAHERLARWLTAESAAVSTNAEEAGTHWERAWQLRQQLGLPAAGGRHLARQGASALGEAGSRSLARGDPKHAADLLDRAVRLARGVAGNGLPADADALWLLRAGEARVMLGDVEGGRQLIAEAQAGASAGGAPLVSAHAALQLAYLQPSGQFTASLAAARTALPLFEAADDRLGIARAQSTIGVVEQSRGRHVQAVAAMERALAETRELDAELEHATVLGALGVSLWQGPDHVDAAIAACRSLLAADAAGRRLVRAALLCPLAMLVAMTGDHQQAAALLTDAETVVDGLANARACAVLPIFTATARLLAGDLAAAESLLVLAHGRCAEIHDAQLADSTARTLCRVRLLLGSDDAAAGLADASASDDMPAAAADRYGLLARVAARSGDPDGARRLGDLAVRAADRTDSPVCQANALLDAALARDDIGDKQAAVGLAMRAERSFTRKGDLVGAGWANDLLTGRRQ